MAYTVRSILYASLYGRAQYILSVRTISYGVTIDTVCKKHVIRYYISKFHFFTFLSSAVS